MRYLAAQTSDKPSGKYPYIRLHPDQLKYWKMTTPKQACGNRRVHCGHGKRTKRTPESEDAAGYSEVLRRST